MKILLLVIFSMVSGCATWQGMSDSEKAMVVVGFVATTAIISSNSSDTLIREICQTHKNKGCN